MPRYTAYWVNGLGEEMSSLVRAEFTDTDGRVFVVVYDWREASRGNGYTVLDKAGLIAYRQEHWNA